MARMIEDEGHRARLTKPLALKRYEAGKLPDPGQCVDCLIIVNDRSDGTPRGRLAISNGASWDHVAWLHEVGQSKAVAVRPAEIDLTPMVHLAVEQALRELPRHEVKVIQQPGLPAPQQDLAPVAQAILEMSEHINRLQYKCAELEARVTAIDGTPIPVMRSA